MEFEPLKHWNAVASIPVSGAVKYALQLRRSAYVARAALLAERPRRFGPLAPNSLWCPQPRQKFIAATSQRGGDPIQRCFLRSV